MGDDKYFKIMFEGNKLAGVILISTTGREHGRIDRLYILQEYQGKGIGSEVLVQIESMFPEVKLWTLDTTKFSPRNHHFYEKHGYVLGEEDDEEKYYYKIIGEIQYDTEKDHNGLDYSTHNFRESNYAKSDWYNVSSSNLWKVIVQNCNMSDTRFTNVNLFNLNNVENTSLMLERCKIVDSTIRDCNLKNLKIESCNLEGATIDGISVEELLECYKKHK